MRPLVSLKASGAMGESSVDAAAAHLRGEVERVLRAAQDGNWRQMLGLGCSCTLASAQRERRRMLRLLHPDPWRFKA